MSCSRTTATVKRANGVFAVITRALGVFVAPRATGVFGLATVVPYQLYVSPSGQNYQVSSSDVNLYGVLK